MIRRPPRSPSFPYTTLFRSLHRRVDRRDAGHALLFQEGREQPALRTLHRGHHPVRADRDDPVHLREARQLRSEEHTSELQSPCNLVCRLLLEKKKKTTL